MGNQRNTFEKVAHTNSPGHTKGFKHESQCLETSPESHIFSAISSDLLRESREILPHFFSRKQETTSAFSPESQRKQLRIKGCSAAQISMLVQQYKQERQIEPAVAI
jgi:hypothetical protein